VDLLQVLPPAHVRVVHAFEMGDSHLFVDRSTEKSGGSPRSIGLCVVNDRRRRREYLEQRAPVGRPPIIGYARLNRMAGLGHKAFYYENIEGGHGAAANLLQQARRYALQYVYFREKLSS